METNATAKTSPWLLWLRFGLVLLIVFGLRLHTVDQVVVDWDESVYLVVAQDLLGGGSLYRTIWDHKGPLLYACVVPVVWLADGSMVAVRLYATAWLLVTLLFVELICRRLVRPDRAFVGALVFGLFFSVPRFGGLAANAELFMMLPATVAVWAGVAWAMGGHRRGWLIAAGLATGAAMLIKPNAVFTAAVVPLLIAVERRSGSRTQWRRLVVDTAAFAGSVAAMLAAASLVFVFAGTFSDLVFATVTFNRLYVAGTPILDAWQQYAAFFGWALMGDPFTMLAAGAGVLLVVGRRRALASSRRRVLVGGLVVCSLAGVCFGRNLFFHYYLQMALPIAIVIVLAVGMLRINPTHLRWVSCTFLVIGTLSAFSPHRSDPAHRSRDPEKDENLWAVAHYIQQHGSPQDRIFVLGGDPVLYYLTGRSTPTKYFFWLFHADRWDAILGSQKTTIEAFERDPPEWFLFTPHAVRVPILEQFMLYHYDLVAEVGAYQIGRLSTSPLP